MDLDMVREFLIADDGTFPGSKFPALFDRSALNIPLLFPATHIKNAFAENPCTNTWDDALLDVHHFHSTSYEVSGIYSGQAEIQPGSDSGPIMSLQKGDVLVIPAGIAHKNLNRNGIGVVGAYPDGRNYI